jgi:hypothetical protein
MNDRVYSNVRCTQWQVAQYVKNLNDSDAEWLIIDIAISQLLIAIISGCFFLCYFAQKGVCMSLTDNGNGLSAADIAAVTGNNGFGSFGGDGGLFWLLVLFLFGFGNGGWGNGGYGGYANIGSEIYPWMNQSQQINDGFRDQMINGNIQGIQNSITSGFGDVQNSLCGGFAGVNASINNAQNGIVQQMYANQIAGMNQSFNNQTAMLQGFNGIQGQLAQCLKAA